MMKLLMLGVVFAQPLGPAADPESPVVVTTRLSPDPSHIGDVLELEVVAAYPKGVSVNLPSGLDFGALHLMGSEEGEPEPTGEGFRKVFTLRFQTFTVESREISSFDLTYVTAQGDVHTQAVAARPFTVESLLVNEVDPLRRGEDPPISVAYPNTLAEVMVYSVLATLILAWIGVVLWRRIRRRSSVVAVVPATPPHEVALEALRELESSPLIADGRFQPYYVQLTEIAKGYLEGRFGVDALDRTTDEIRSALLQGAVPIEPLSPGDVVAFLDRCDLVKFARVAPDPSEAEDALGQVRDMVARSHKGDGGGDPLGATEETST